MKLAVIGTGYVGLVSGACLASLGHHVTCIDQDQDKIAKLRADQVPFYEPDLEVLVKQGTKSDQLQFSNALAAVIDTVEVVFVAVGTPTSSDNETADLSFLFAACAQVAKLAKSPKILVIKSTVPVGTAAKIYDHIKSENPLSEIQIVSNPEFLREGHAVGDFLKPDRIILGLTSETAHKKMLAVYQKLAQKNVPILFTSHESAEIIKYAANCYLAMRIGYINQISDLCEAAGANIEEVVQGAGYDARIGRHYFSPGPGFGGSCFPKDTRAFAATGRQFNRPLTIIEDVIDANDRRKTELAARVSAILGEITSQTKITILGLAFKAETDDMRDAASLVLIPALQKMGAQIFAYDPQAMENAKIHFQDVSFATSASDAAKAADAVVILTEWTEFKEMDLRTIAQQMKGNILIDFRNLFDAETAITAKLNYVPLGHPVTKLVR